MFYLLLTFTWNAKGYARFRAPSFLIISYYCISTVLILRRKCIDVVPMTEFETLKGCLIKINSIRTNSTCIIRHISQKNDWRKHVGKELAFLVPRVVLIWITSIELKAPFFFLIELKYFVIFSVRRCYWIMIWCI